METDCFTASNTFNRQILLKIEKAPAILTKKRQAPDWLKFHILFLLAAGLLAGVECRAGRLLLGGAAGAASSLALLAPEVPDAAALLYKVSTAALTVAAAYGWPGRRCFARLVG